MARPKNHVILVDGKILSVNPRNLKAGLEKIAKGEKGEFAGKLVGYLEMNVSALTAAEAKEILESLEPVKEAETTIVTIPA